MTGQAAPMEVFLCVNRESFSERFETDFIERLVRKAHASMWGAKVYVVIDHDAEQSVPTLGVSEGAAARPPEWFETLLGNDVSDILQWSVRSPDGFVDATRRSETRMKRLVTDVPSRPWKCVMRTPPNLSPQQKSFLAPYLAGSLKKIGGENCLLVLQERRDNYMKYLRRALDPRPRYKVIIGVVDQIDDPPGDLEKFCEDEGYELVHFHGLVELYYFLRRLNSINESEATPVRVVNPVFKSHAPQLLITHSYTATDKGGCLAAANDVWELTKDLRGTAKVRIYPAVKCVKLADIIDELQHVLAWIHIGHGDDVGRLKEAEETYQPAVQWLNSFAGYKSSLALAMFSSCYSAPVAKRFAESGVGVSIGFAQEVHKKSCVHLTKRVIKAALESNGSQKAIIEAFSEGRRKLGLADPAALPVAFWASH